jgi:hypothetical protein
LVGDGMNRKHVIIIVVTFLAMIVVFTGVFMAVLSNKPVEKVQAETQENKVSDIDKKYNEGIVFIEKYDYMSACTALTIFSEGNYNNDEKFKDAQMVFFYAQAQLSKDDNPSKALEYLSKIPNEYAGKYAGEIRILRELLRNKLNQEASQNTIKVQNDQVAESQQNLKEQLIYIEDDLRQKIANYNGQLERLKLKFDQNYIGVDDYYQTVARIKINKEQAIIDAMDKEITKANAAVFPNESEKRIKLHELNERRKNAVNKRAEHEDALSEIISLGRQMSQQGR